MDSSLVQQLLALKGFGPPEAAAPTEIPGETEEQKRRRLMLESLRRNQTQVPVAERGVENITNPQGGVVGQRGTLRLPGVGMPAATQPMADQAQMMALLGTIGSMMQGGQPLGLADVVRGMGQFGQ